MESPPSTLLRPMGCPGHQHSTKTSKQVRRRRSGFCANPPPSRATAILGHPERILQATLAFRFHPPSTKSWLKNGLDTFLVATNAILPIWARALVQMDITSVSTTNNEELTPIAPQKSDLAALPTAPHTQPPNNPGQAAAGDQALVPQNLGDIFDSFNRTALVDTPPVKRPAK